MKLLNKVKEIISNWLFGSIIEINEDLIMTINKFDVVKLDVVGFNFNKIAKSKCGGYVLLINIKYHEVVLLNLNTIYWKHRVNVLLGRIKNPTIIQVDVTDKVRYTHFLNDNEINMFDPWVDIDYFKSFEVVDGVVKVNGAIYERKGYPSIREGILEEDLDFFFN